jgi:hypothetical protein
MCAHCYMYTYMYICYIHMQIALWLPARLHLTTSMRCSTCMATLKCFLHVRNSIYVYMHLSMYALHTFCIGSHQTIYSCLQSAALVRRPTIKRILSSFRHLFLSTLVCIRAICVYIALGLVPRCPEASEQQRRLVTTALTCIEPLYVNFFKTASDPLGTDSNAKIAVAPIEGRVKFPSHLGLVYMVSCLPWAMPYGCKAFI